jgi:hypothetical protein
MNIKNTLGLFLIVLLSYNTCKAQDNIKCYEEIALNGFFTSDNMRDYEHVKYYIFDGELSDDLSGRYSFCILVSCVKGFNERTEKSISIPDREDIKSRLGMFRRFFVNDDKIRRIRVHRYYPYNDDYIVVVEVFNNMYNDFFSFIIDSETKQIKESCNQLRYH